MSRDDPPKEAEGAVCVEFLDTQICVDENGSISVYTGVSDDDSDDGFRHVAAASSVVGGYVDSDDDIARRLREWADENRDRIAACILQARDISALVSENKDLKLEVEGLRAQLNERYVAMRVRQLEEALVHVRAENKRMREALRKTACACSSTRECPSPWPSDISGWCQHLNARMALEGKSLARKP